MGIIGLIRAWSAAWLMGRHRLVKRASEWGLAFGRSFAAGRSRFVASGRVTRKRSRRLLSAFRVVRVGIILSLLAAVGLYVHEQSTELFRVIVDDVGSTLVALIVGTFFASLALWSWSQRLFTLLARIIHE